MVGETVSLDCIDTTETATSVQWLNSTGHVLASSTTLSVSLNINPITDVHHGMRYTCRIHAEDLMTDLIFTVIILGKV